MTYIVSGDGALNSTHSVTAVSHSYLCMESERFKNWSRLRSSHQRRREKIVCRGEFYPNLTMWGDAQQGLRGTKPTAEIRFGAF